MKLLNFKRNNEQSFGIKTDQGILDIKQAGIEFNEKVPENTDELLKNDADALIKALLQRANERDHPSLFVDENEIEYLPSVLNPEKIICVGLNYLEHVEEARTEKVPETPVLFNKFNNALAAHKENVSLPEAGEKFDYEAELVIVIGKEASDVGEDEALSYVYGYTTGNDLSIRDLQFRTGQWLLGKTSDGFGPIGPYLVSGEGIDPQNLDIACRVNGEVRQSSNTKHMIFNCATIISYISKHMTLKPGDIIFTGTPEGVIIGYDEKDQNWLKPGDVVEVEIEKVGTLKNTLK